MSDNSSVCNFDLVGFILEMKHVTSKIATPFKASNNVSNLLAEKSFDTLSIGQVATYSGLLFICAEPYQLGLI